jgi:hypothetical protein
MLHGFPSSSHQFRNLILRSFLGCIPAH